ncbi:MAG: HAMP domain-containing protein [Chloroflexales bacterium]|nr:HAMP domain-containing protein [Chloroflexales bacterium]
MRQLVNEYRSKIQYTVIGPYLALMILVMLVGSFVAVTLVADSWQERFNNQMGQVARNFTESFAQREMGNIEYLSRISFTAPNSVTGAPSVPQAMATGDTAGLELALSGLWQVGQSTESVKADRLIVFDPAGRSLSDWERTPGNPAEPTRYVGTKLAGIPLIDAVLRGESKRVQGSETIGDKYSGLISFQSSDGKVNLHFFTVAPVYLTDQATGSERLVGGLLVAQRLDSLLQDLQRRSQAAVSTIYDVSGIARATTVTGIDLSALDMNQALIDQVAALNAPGAPTPSGERSGNPEDPCLDIGNLTGRLVSPVEMTRLPSCSVADVSQIADRQYQFVYAPLLIRGVQSGYFSVGLSTDFVISAWSASRSAVLGITAALALTSVIVGWQVARRITRPLSNLVETAEAVTSGDLKRRSAVVNQNELGKLSVAFNQMTEHLLRLYTASRELNRTIEVAQVLTVATQAASSFVPGTEAVALLEDPEGFRYYSRPGSAVQLPETEVSLAADTPILAEMAAYDPQEIQLIRVSGPEVLESAGLDPSLGTAYKAPVFRQRHLAGALLFLHPDPAAFSEADEQSLAVIANMAVAVLSNAVLYGQVQRDAKERRAILASIGDGVVVCDDKGRIALLNGAAEQILDLPDWQTARPRLADLPLEAVSESRELFGQGGAQFQLGERFITLTRSPVIGEDGQSSGEVIVLHDVTESVMVGKAKTDFIATISHELRTPLTVIRGFTELLLRGTGGDKPSADQADLLSQVRARAVDMTDMVNNAILIADIESGQLKTEWQPVDLEMVVSAAMISLRQGFEAKNLLVAIEIPEDLPPVMADREQLKRAFGQLLDNARRYTERGGVTLRAQAEGPNVRVDVIDTGPGIAPEVLPRLFKRFQRIEGNNSTQRGGGLGLAITRQLIERQGGSVSVSSVPGQGSTFTIILQQVNEHSLAVAQTNDSAATP